MSNIEGETPASDAQENVKLDVIRRAFVPSVEVFEDTLSFLSPRYLPRDDNGRPVVDFVGSSAVTMNHLSRAKGLYSTQIDAAQEAFDPRVHLSRTVPFIHLIPKVKVRKTPLNEFTAQIAFMPSPQSQEELDSILNGIYSIPSLEPAQTMTGGYIYAEVPVGALRTSPETIRGAMSSYARRGFEHAFRPAGLHTETIVGIARAAKPLIAQDEPDLI